MSAMGRNNRTNWTAMEDSILVQSLMELVQEGGWRSDNGTFRNKYHNELLRLMHLKLPGCSITSTSVIDTRVKSLKRQYQAIAEMLGNTCSGFGWNDKYKCIEVEPTVFDTWVQAHPTAKGLNNKPFPHYDDLAYIFGKDRACGSVSQSARDIAEEDWNAEVGEEGGSQGYYRPEIPVAEEEDPNTPTSRVVKPSSSSVGEKRKRVSEKQEMLDVLRVGMNMQYDQIVRIADWPVTTLQVTKEDKKSTRAEVARILQTLSPPLTNPERVVLMKILLKDLDEASAFLEVPENDRRDYCDYLLNMP